MRSIAGYRHTEAYTEAQARRDSAVQAAMLIAHRAQRDPSTTREYDAEKRQFITTTDPEQPTLARLRGDEATKVKRWLWYLTNREAIKHADSPSMLGTEVLNTFQQAIPLLEQEAGQATASTKIRLTTVVTKLRECVEAIQSAEQDMKTAERTWREQEVERFVQNTGRQIGLIAYAEFVALTYDVCDNLGVEYRKDDKSTYNPSYSKLCGWLSECCQKVPNGYAEHPFVVAVDEALKHAEKGQWSRAWHTLSDLPDMFPLDQEATPASAGERPEGERRQ